MSDAVITCEDLVVGYGGQPLLPPIDVSLRKGRICAILGRNGSGKSTFVKTLLGLLPPVGGEMRKLRPDLRMAYAPQASSLDEIIPVRTGELVLWGRLRGWSFLRPLPSREDLAARDRALAAADATSFARLPFRNLSGGQKQRGQFAKLLALDPELALLDEPTAAMDEVAEKAAVDNMRALARSGVAVAVVAHDMVLVGQFADDALFLDRDHKAIVAGTLATVYGDHHFQMHYGTIPIAGDKQTRQHGHQHDHDFECDHDHAH